MIYEVWVFSLSSFSNWTRVGQSVCGCNGGRWGCRSVSVLSSGKSFFHAMVSCEIFWGFVKRCVSFGGVNAEFDDVFNMIKGGVD